MNKIQKFVMYHTTAFLTPSVGMNYSNWGYLLAYFTTALISVYGTFKALQIQMTGEFIGLVIFVTVVAILLTDGLFHANFFNAIILKKSGKLDIARNELKELKPQIKNAKGNQFAALKRKEAHAKFVVNSYWSMLAASVFGLVLQALIMGNYGSDVAKSMRRGQLAAESANATVQRPKTVSSKETHTATPETTVQPKFDASAFTIIPKDVARDAALGNIAAKNRIAEIKASAARKADDARAKFQLARDKIAADIRAKETQALLSTNEVEKTRLKIEADAAARQAKTNAGLQKLALLEAEAANRFWWVLSLITSAIQLFAGYRIAVVQAMQGAADNPQFFNMTLQIFSFNDYDFTNIENTDGTEDEDDTQQTTAPPITTTPPPTVTPQPQAGATVGNIGNENLETSETSETSEKINSVRFYIERYRPQSRNEIIAANSAASKAKHNIKKEMERYAQTMESEPKHKERYLQRRQNYENLAQARIEIAEYLNSTQCQF